jgi:uncharacterized membrane-anchored protein
MALCVLDRRGTGGQFTLGKVGLRPDGGNDLYLIMKSKNICWMSVQGFFLALLTAVSFEGAAIAAEEESERKDIPWQKGPSTAKLKNTALLKLPEGYRFVDGDITRKLLQSAGEPTSGDEMGMVRPPEGEWSVFFDFSGDGYVKDDDKDKLNADKLLNSIKKGNDYANKQRRKMGYAPLNIIGWEQKPNYNPETHNLEWAIRAESEGRPVLNYNTRLLGRHGVTEVVLVCEPDELSTILPTFKELLTGFSYAQGESYAEYKPGDKVAKYGLAALVTGGAVAVAAKTGLLTAIVLFLKKGWKLVVIGVAALLAGIKKLFTGRGSTA